MKQLYISIGLISLAILWQSNSWADEEPASVKKPAGTDAWTSGIKDGQSSGKSKSGSWDGGGSRDNGGSSKKSGGLSPEYIAWKKKQQSGGSGPGGLETNPHRTSSPVYWEKIIANPGVRFRAPEGMNQDTFDAITDAMRHAQEQGDKDALHKFIKQAVGHDWSSEPKPKFLGQFVFREGGIGTRVPDGGDGGGKPPITGQGLRPGGGPTLTGSGSPPSTGLGTDPGQGGRRLTDNGDGGSERGTPPGGGTTPPPTGTGLGDSGFGPTDRAGIGPQLPPGGITPPDQQTPPGDQPPPRQLPPDSPPNEVVENEPVSPLRKGHARKKKNGSTLSQGENTNLAIETGSTNGTPTLRASAGPLVRGPLSTRSAPTSTTSTSLSADIQRVMPILAKVEKSKDIQLLVDELPALERLAKTQDPQISPAVRKLVQKKVSNIKRALARKSLGFEPPPSSGRVGMIAPLLAASKLEIDANDKFWDPTTSVPKKKSISSVPEEPKDKKAKEPKLSKQDKEEEEKDALANNGYWEYLARLSSFNSNRAPANAPQSASLATFFQKFLSALGGAEKNSHSTESNSAETKTKFSLPDVFGFFSGSDDSAENGTPNPLVIITTALSVLGLAVGVSLKYSLSHLKGNIKKLQNSTQPNSTDTTAKIKSSGGQK